MEHLNFIIWMLGYPLTIELIELIGRVHEPRIKERSENDKVILGGFHLLLWFGVGVALW